MGRPRKNSSKSSKPSQAQKDQQGIFDAAKEAIGANEVANFKSNPDNIYNLIVDYIGREKVTIDEVTDDRVKKYYYAWADKAGLQDHNSDSWKAFVTTMIGQSNFVREDSLYDLWSVGFKVFSKIYNPGKYRMRFDGLSQFGGLVFEEFRPYQEGEGIPGVALEGKWTTVNSLKLATKFLGHMEGDSLIEFWKQIWFPPQNSNTLTMMGNLEKVTQGKDRMEEWSNFSFNKSAVNIPGSYAIDENLSKLSIDDLLCIFPKAERKILALWIGRAFFGGGDIDNLDLEGMSKPNDWRYAVILSGDPKTGKSFLIDQIIRYATWLGLQTASTDLEGRQFGGERIARAHIAYNMDATSNQVYSWSHASNTNSYISGDMVSVEEKYQPRREALAHSAFIVACNNPSFGGKMPPGAVDRLIVLETEPKCALMNSGVKSLYHAWQDTIKKMRSETGIDYNFLSLMARLVACSVEEYITILGLQYNDDTELYRQVNDSRLTDAIDELRKDLRFRTTTNVPAKLSMSTVRATAITKWLFPYCRAPKGHHQLKYNSLGHIGRIITALREIPELKANIDPDMRVKLNQKAEELSDWLVEDLTHYHYTVWSKIASKSAHYDSISFAPTCPDLTSLLKETIKEIAVDTGEPVPQGTSLWTHKLSEENYNLQVEVYVAEIKSLIGDPELAECFRQLLTSAGNCEYPIAPGISMQRY